MKKEVVVISLGGSLIVPEQVNLSYLESLKTLLFKKSYKYKFVIVCGGGHPARVYIKGLRTAKKSEYLQSLIGISVTRLNARLVSYLFGFDQEGIPHDMRQVSNLLRKNDFVAVNAFFTMN